jgi:OmpA-OmpF porin, OOP family
MSIRALCLGLCVAFSTLLSMPLDAAASPLPSYLAFLPSVMTLRTPEYEDWDEYQIPQSPWEATSPGTLRHGKHWHLLGSVNDNSTDNAATWASLRKGFLAAGWSELKIYPNGGYAIVLHFKKENTEAWTWVTIGQPHTAWIDTVELTPVPLSFTLPAPAPKPEKIVRNADFSYLPALPIAGTKRGSEGPDASPFRVSIPGQDEPELVATGSYTKTYHPPANLSNYEWINVYRDALMKAGWTIVNAVRSELIVAHYGKNGRNIWTYMHMNVDGYSITVGDEGESDDALKSDLAKQCHVPLLGVLFDFNKATLRPESDAVLERVRDLLDKDTTLNVEVQGHTDDVGTAPYNLALSDARAASVVAWLTQHGVAPGRLSPKGYGLTMPIADNKTDEGRAKNRRVEIADKACKPNKM